MILTDLITNSQEFISKRILERPKVTNFLAATVKNARIKRRLTLAQAVKNICSQSSWSKYENNYLTLPSEVIQSVCEGMGLNYQELVKVNKINNLPECVKYYLYDKLQEVEEMYELTNNDLFLSRDSLIKVIYYLMTERYDELVLEIQALDNVKNTLSDYELLMLLICTIEYYIKMHYFIEANKYINIINLLTTDDKTLEILILQQKFIISCNLRDYKTLHANYTDLIKATAKNYPIRKKAYAKLLFLEAHPNQDALTELDNIYYETDDSYKSQYWYSRFIILIEMGKFHEVIKNIISLELNHISFVALFGYAIVKVMSNDREIKDLSIYKQKFDKMYLEVEYSDNDEIHLDFLKYLKVILNDQDNTDNELNFLRNYLIPKLKSTQHRLYTSIYASRYTSLLGKRSKYKEAYLFSTSNIDLLKGLHYQQF